MIPRKVILELDALNLATSTLFSWIGNCVLSMDFLALFFYLILVLFIGCFPSFLCLTSFPATFLLFLPFLLSLIFPLSSYFFGLLVSPYLLFRNTTWSHIILYALSCVTLPKHKRSCFWNKYQWDKQCITHEHKFKI